MLRVYSFVAIGYTLHLTRDIKPNSEMKTIKVIQKNGNQHTIYVSDCDYDLVKNYKWHISTPIIKNTNNKLYYAQTYINGKSIRMHRFLLNPSENLLVDHIDGNGLNNQRENIRICTKSENQRNKRSCGRSKFLGVGFHKGKFRAYINVNGKNIHIGRYESEIEAAINYNLNAKKYFGDFANLNII